jgi:hypothetical protein
VRSRVALAVVLALLAPAAAAHAQAPRAPVGGDLFVLTAAGGQLERVPGRSGVFELTLRRPARDVTFFTDRPARRAGELPLGRFVRRWRQLGFGDVPPNAALVLADAPNNRDVLVVELSRPRLVAGGRRLGFRAVALRGNPGDELREFRRKADRRVGSRLGRVSLFVDPSGQNVRLNFQVGGVPASGDPFSIAFTIASVDRGTPVNVNQTGPASFVLSENNFSLFATGGSSVNAGVQLGVDVPSTATSVGGAAIVPSGASASVTVASTNKTFPIPNGPFSIPLR